MPTLFFLFFQGKLTVILVVWVALIVLTTFYCYFCEQRLFPNNKTQRLEESQYSRLVFPFQVFLCQKILATKPKFFSKVVLVSTVLVLFCNRKQHFKENLINLQMINNWILFLSISWRPCLKVCLNVNYGRLLSKKRVHIFFIHAI